MFSFVYAQHREDERGPIEASCLPAPVSRPDGGRG
jgi:hypothetical protein